ncbi:uncharacterized protein LOC128394248 [Panonychus citri]|uniref:uncharacterized protein LOC128394248 n=1 Tax=Panonychus citri TaxID=50023 RepID=UPI002307C9D4|nr:uncharacterized protein LOC128394248 [Panonychus citri]
MNINDLPNDCLLLIFDQFYQLRQFATFMKVCRRWKILVEKRLKKITHLDVSLFTPLIQNGDSAEQYLPITHRCIITISRRFLMKIKLSKLFPNVKIIHLENFTKNCPCALLVHLLTNTNQIKGLSYLDYRFEMSHKCKILEREEKRITSFLSDIEFLGISNDIIVTSYLRTFGHLKKLKSLGNCLENYFQPVNLLHVLKFTQFLMNLERLVTFCNDEFDNDFVRVENQLPIFGNLLHLQLENISKKGSSFTKFLNLCPNLLNLSLIVHNVGVERIHQINKNLNVQRLNLLFSWDRDKMLKVIEKFPNCRYLSIGGYALLSSRDLIQIITILPRLSLFLIENERNDLAERQIVKSYCHSQNRKIDVYFGSTDDKLMMSHELYRKFHNSFLYK